jgi:hypothetical protein
VPWRIPRKIARDFSDFGHHLVRNLVGSGTFTRKGQFESTANFLAHSARATSFLKSLVEALGKPNGRLYRFVIFLSFHISHLHRVPFSSTLSQMGLTCHTLYAMTSDNAPKLSVMITHLSIHVECFCYGDYNAQ